MQFLPNWSEVLKRSWSIYMMVLAGLFSTAEGLLLFFENSAFEGVPKGLFAALAGVFSALAVFVRLLAQQNLSGAPQVQAFMAKLEPTDVLPPQKPIYARMRWWYLGAGSLAVLLLSFKFDPFEGAATATWMLYTARFFVGTLAIFSGYRALHDYPEADGRTAAAECLKGNTAAAGILIARGLTLIALALLFMSVSQAQDVRTYIPENARKHVPELAKIQRQYFPQHTQPWTMAALGEHESCVRLTSPKCWSTKAALKTEREEGVGPTQITRAYRVNPDGSRSVRFDSLTALRAKHPELSGWGWHNVYDRMDYQLLAMVLKTRDNWTHFRHTKDPVPFVSTAHNRGEYGILKEIQACALKKGCDPGLWWGHVETTCTASRKPIYAGKSACDISREHARSVLLVRSPKYKQFWATL